MRMSIRNIVIAGIILSLVFVYTVHINWKQKKELASYATEMDVYEKHVDELTAKLNECMDRKTQWGNQFEAEKKRSAQLKSELDSAVAEARKSQADSSAQSRQSGERLADLEGQVKVLTEVRTSLERENQDLKRQRADRLANETDALASLRAQLERALASEKRLRERLEVGGTSVNATSTTASATATATATAGAGANATSTASSADANSTATTANPSSSTSTSTSSAAAKSAGGGDAAESAGAGRVLRPPLKVDGNRGEAGTAAPAAAAGAPAAEPPI